MIYALAVRGRTLKYGAMPAMYLGVNQWDGHAYVTIESRKGASDFDTFQEQFQYWIDNDDLEFNHKGDPDDWNGPYDLLSDPDSPQANFAEPQAFVKLWSDYFQWEKDEGRRLEDAEKRRRAKREKEQAELLEREKEAEKRYQESPAYDIDRFMNERYGPGAYASVRKDKRVDSRTKEITVTTVFSLMSRGDENAREMMKLLGFPEELIRKTLNHPAE